MRAKSSKKTHLTRKLISIALAAITLSASIPQALAQSNRPLAPPTSALKYGWYAVQLGAPIYDPDPAKTNLWSMYQFCFGEARKYHIEKFHVTLAHLSNDPTCVRADGKAPTAIPRRPGCVSVQLTADCVAEPEGIIPEVDPEKLALAWRKALDAISVHPPADFIAFRDAQPNGLLKFEIRVSRDYQILPSAQWIEAGVQNGSIQPGTVAGAKYLLVGSVQVAAPSAISDGALLVNARLVEVETGEVKAGGQGTERKFSQYGLELDVASALAGLNTQFRN